MIEFYETLADICQEPGKIALATSLFSYIALGVYANYCIFTEREPRRTPID